MTTNAETTSSFNWKKTKRFIIIFTIVGVAIMAGLGIYADYNELGDSIAKFNFKYLPLILCLAPLNYCLRFFKWNFYLKRLGIKVKKGVNFPVYLAGLCMTITPGKIGELFKSYLLKELSDIPVAETAPLILMERITDGVSMIILASVGAAAFSYGWSAIVVSILLVSAFVAVIRIKPISDFILRLLTKIKFLKRFSSSFEKLHSQTYELMHPVTFTVAVCIGLVSWLFEGFVIFFALKAFSVDISPLASIFAVAVSSIVGAMSMLPGGLLVAEGSIMGILVALFEVNPAIASATTIVTRFSTLWLGVAIGLVAMIFVQRLINKNNLNKEHNQIDTHSV